MRIHVIFTCNNTWSTSVINWYPHSFHYQISITHHFISILISTALRLLGRVLLRVTLFPKLTHSQHTNCWDADCKTLDTFQCWIAKMSYITRFKLGIHISFLAVIQTNAVKLCHKPHGFLVMFNTPGSIVTEFNPNFLLLTEYTILAIQNG